MFHKSVHNVLAIRTRQTLIRSNDNIQHSLDWANFHQRMQVLSGQSMQINHNLADFPGVWTRLGHPFLRFFQMRRCHKFHGFGDMVNFADATNPSANFQTTLHGAASYLYLNSYILILSFLPSLTLRETAP